MAEERIPINEFRAKTAEILESVCETKASYVITNRGRPVAEVVPYGTPIRKKGKPILGIFANPDHILPWKEEGISEQQYLDRRRAERLAEQEARHRKLSAQLGWEHDDEADPAK
jgi:prevent-host-death family protein